MRMHRSSGVLAALLAWALGAPACDSGPGLQVGDTPTAPGADAGEHRADSGGSDAGGSVDPTGNGAPLNGAFLEVLNNHDADHWKAVVRAMKQLQMEEIIIQTESYLTTAGTRNEVLRSNLRAVLDQAQASGMRAWLGLVLPEYGNGSVAHATDARFIETLISESKKSADGIWNAFGGTTKHPAFGGWYIPVETWTPGTAAQLGDFSADGVPTSGSLRYVYEISRYCAAKSEPPLPVAFSPFISDLATDPTLTESLYTKLLKASAVTHVLLQDGVGARNITDFTSLPAAEKERRVVLYFHAMARAASTAQRTFWANVESFAGAGFHAPAPFSRFDAQIGAVREIVSGMVTYEFSNYWVTASPGLPPTALSTDYRAKYLPGP
ncbi:MAG: DUF4434 domain-containing protein [Deltaproteobacteria bacterium]|nr:DUF4434 domain-containing protein [Deltaproteobacteria bacterium]